DTDRGDFILVAEEAKKYGIIDDVIFKNLFVLLNQGILRSGQYLYQSVLAQAAHRGDYRKTAHELGDETELYQIFRKGLVQYLPMR
ncbi:hypothetical protein HKBW3S42_02123, partial [Candidatus Hakubella thermalkaliphila]